MAKYSKKAQDKVGKVMHEYKHGELKSGPGGKGGKPKSRKQAVAIAISEARKEGDKVPPKKSSSGGSKKAATGARKKTTAKKTGASKPGPKTGSRKKTASK